MVKLGKATNDEDAKRFFEANYDTGIIWLRGVAGAVKRLVDRGIFATRYNNTGPFQLSTEWAGTILDSIDKQSVVDTMNAA